MGVSEVAAVLKVVGRVSEVAAVLKVSWKGLGGGSCVEG
jgi:hypothetical protein